MTINSQELIQKAKNEILEVEQEIKKLEQKAKKMASDKALNISKLFLNNDLDFPVDVISLSLSGSIKSLVLFLETRLLRESELTTEMLQFLVRENVAKNTIIQQKIQESFNSWSESTQFKFSLSCPYEHMFYRYDFINDHLLKYSIGQNTKFFKEKGLLNLTGYNPQTLSSAFKIRLDLIDSFEKVKVAASYIVKALELGYLNTIPLTNIDFFLTVEDKNVFLTEERHYNPTKYTFSGSLEQQLIEAIHKALEIKSESEETENEHSY